MDITSPGHNRPVICLHAQAQVEQINRLSDGCVVREPPGVADALIVVANDESRSADRSY